MKTDFVEIDGRQIPPAVADEVDSTRVASATVVSRLSVYGAFYGRKHAL